MRHGSTVRVAAGFRLALALVLALLGFAVTDVFVSGSRAAGVTTTIPQPDPPPTTSVQRTVPHPAPPPPQPQTQTQPVVPPPPPSPPVSPPPASPPPAPPTPPATIAQPPAHVQHVRKPVARHLAKRVRVPAHFAPPRPPNLQRDAAAMSVVTPPAASPPSSTPMLVMLAIAIGLTLIGVATAMMPAWALPQFVFDVVDKRRSDIVFAGIAVLLSVGVGLLVVLGLK
jgi:outer membrane biosynthesis protein TonB